MNDLGVALFQETPILGPLNPLGEDKKTCFLAGFDGTC